VDNVNKYFTTAVLSIASASVIFWLLIDANKAINALTAVLIVACPCGLLLASTFTNGNLLRLFGKNKFYLKNTSVIEELSKVDTIVFDKTGTITHGSHVKFVGPKLTEHELQIAATLASQSIHPLSRKIQDQFLKGTPLNTQQFEEVPGNGIKGAVDGKYALLGSEYFVTGSVRLFLEDQSSKVFFALEGIVLGYFSINNQYRTELKQTIEELSKKYSLNLLSGDNDHEKAELQKIFGNTSDLLFNQKPEDKLNYIKQLQQKGYKVAMIGDGLNDAGALKQSNVGIAVSDDINNFSPACDAIVDGTSFSKIVSFLSFAKAGKKIITASFIISTIYNIIGLSFAVQGTLSPVVAAILMPISSVSIVLLTTLASTVAAKRKGL
jgi:Cu+-exporting ATPase